MTIGIPAEYGGDGLDWLSKYIVCDELAQGDAGLTTTMLASTLLASDPIWVAANDEQKMVVWPDAGRSNLCFLSDRARSWF